MNYRTASFVLALAFYTVLVFAVGVYLGAAMVRAQVEYDEWDVVAPQVVWKR